MCISSSTNYNEILKFNRYLSNNVNPFGPLILRASAIGLMSDERSVKLKQLLFFIVWQNINERCVKCEICPQNDHFSNTYFQVLRPLTHEIENNQKRKPMCTTTMYLELKLIWFDYLALALPEPLPGNQRPKQALKRKSPWLVADIYFFFPYWLNGDSKVTYVLKF